MYKKYGNVSQKFGDSTSYKKVINKHPNLYTNNSLTKQTNNPLISNKYSNRSNSANKKRPTHLVNLSHPISKNFKVDTQITKLNPKLNSTRLTVHKKSFSCGKRFSSINNSFYNKHSLNDSWVFNKNINKSNSEKKERAKTPNMTKINSSKLNVSKLNLNAFSMGGSPNIKVSNNCNPKNKNNVSHINNLNGHKVHSKGGGFVKKNIFSRFKKKFSMDPSSKQKASVVVNEDNYKMINKMNNNNKNNQNAHNHSSTTQPTEKEAAISNDSGNGNKKTNNLMHIFSGVENVINKETNRMSKNINHNNYMDVTSENFELKNNKVQISTNGHFIKKIKCIHDLSKTGLSGDEKKVNQDNYFIFKNFNNTFTDIFMGVW